MQAKLDQQNKQVGCVFRMCVFCYRGLQVGWHKFADENSRMHILGGDFELKILRMHEFLLQICANQPANLYFHSQN